MDGDCYQSTLTEMAIKIPNRKSPQQIETIFSTIFLRVSKKEDSFAAAMHSFSQENGNTQLTFLIARLTVVAS